MVWFYYTSGTLQSTWTFFYILIYGRRALLDGNYDIGWYSISRRCDVVNQWFDELLVMAYTCQDAIFIAGGVAAVTTHGAGTEGKFHGRNEWNLCNANWWRCSHALSLPTNTPCFDLHHVLVHFLDVSRYSYTSSAYFLRLWNDIHETKIFISGMFLALWHYASILIQQQQHVARKKIRLSNQNANGTTSNCISGLEWNKQHQYRTYCNLKIYITWVTPFVSELILLPWPFYHQRKYP